MSFNHPFLGEHHRNILLLDGGVLHLISFENRILSRFQVMDIEQNLNPASFLSLFDKEIDVFVFASAAYSLLPSELLGIYSQDELYSMCGLESSGFPLVSSFRIGNDLCVLLASLSHNLHDLKVNCDIHEKIWLDSLLKMQGISVAVDFRQNRFNVAIFKEGALQLINSFTYASVSDFLYYLLGAADHAKIPYHELICHVSGMVSPSSPLIEKMRLHFKDIEFLCPPAYSDKNSQPWIHQYFHLKDL